MTPKILKTVGILVLAAICAGISGYLLFDRDTERFKKARAEVTAQAERDMAKARKNADAYGRAMCADFARVASTELGRCESDVAYYVRNAGTTETARGYDKLVNGGGPSRWDERIALRVSMQIGVWGPYGADGLPTTSAELSPPNATSYAAPGAIFAALGGLFWAWPVSTRVMSAVTATVKARVNTTPKKVALLAAPFSLVLAAGAARDDLARGQLSTLLVLASGAGLLCCVISLTRFGDWLFEKED